MLVHVGALLLTLAHVGPQQSRLALACDPPAQRARQVLMDERELMKSLEAEPVNVKVVLEREWEPEPEPELELQVQVA